MLNDPLAAALAKINNAERAGKKEVILKPASKMLRRMLEIMNEHNYIGAVEEDQENTHTVLKINLLGRINKCNVIKPRFSTKLNSFQKWEKRYLPAKDFGFIVVTTPLGVMTHLDAKNKNVGGKLLAYCY